MMSAFIQSMGNTTIADKPAVADTDFVKPAKPAPPQVVALSPADQNMPDRYICFLMLLPLSTSSNKQALHSKLKAGLSLTLSEFPLIGGRLAPVDGAVGEKVQINIDDNHGLQLIYRDFTTHESESGFKHSYHELKRNNFPCSAFDAEKILPVAYRPTKPEPAVMAIQANFIHGGLILSVCAHHKAFDVLSSAVMLKTWAKHMAAADLANGDILSATIDNLVPRSMSRAPMCDGLLEAQSQDFPEYRVFDDRTSISPPPVLKSPLGPLKLCIIYMSASHLVDLKSAASPPKASDGWVSTNDAICALLWRHITHARSHVAKTLQQQPGLPNSSPSTKGPLEFGLVVEARRRMVPALPEDYLGNAAFYCPVTSDLDTVASPATPLFTIANQIRQAVSSFDTAKMRGLLGLIDSLPKASDLLIRIHDNPMRGLVVTSWANSGLYGLDWGTELGKVESVRVPNVVPPWGTPVCRVFPRLPDGGLEVMVCLEEPAIEALREDEEFMAFAEWKCM